MRAFDRDAFRQTRCVYDYVELTGLPLFLILASSLLSPRLFYLLLFHCSLEVTNLLCHDVLKCCFIPFHHIPSHLVGIYSMERRKIAEMDEEGILIFCFGGQIGKKNIVVCIHVCMRKKSCRNAKGIRSLLRHERPRR